MNCGLCAGDEHYDLRRDGPKKLSQLQFKCNSKGQCCVVYTEDSITKTNDGGLNSLRKDRKIVWIYPSVNPVRCPVRIIGKYMSLLPPVKSESSKHNFYLRPLEKPNPACWYSSQEVGLNTLRKTIGEIVKETKTEVFFTNHSLHRTSTTHLFQVGVPKKIIREFTGHRSDALAKYEVTSEDQKESLSKIIA